MNVLLLSPPSRIINHYRPPLALMYLSGYLKRNNIKTKIIDITLRDQVRDRKFFAKKDDYLLSAEEEIVNRVKKIESDIVGITCYTPELEEVQRLAKKIKLIKQNVKIIVGGIHPTLYPQDFLSPESDFDFVVIGEGEIALFELVKSLKSDRKNDYKNVNGIGYFDKDSMKMVLNGKQPLASNLDDISFPDYEDIDMEFYTIASPYAIRGVFTRSFYISSSRGCPSSCTFCVSKKLRGYHGINNFVRLRSPQSLFDEIRQLREEYKIDSFYFIDDLFTLNKENVLLFCNLMKKNKLPLIWGCSSRVNTVNSEMLKIMKMAGCVQIDFGVERGSDQALRKLKKGITIEQIVRTFDNCHKLGIRTFANMLVNVPGEEEKDLQDIISIVKKIKPHIVSFNIFTPYPGCEIYDLFTTSIEKKDYPLLMEDPAWLIEKWPEKFKFAKHSIDFINWVSNATKRFNRILPNILIYIQPQYIKNIIFSRNKINYLFGLQYFIKEFITLKLSN